MADLCSMKNRVVLLTGASRGLGRDMALTLAAAGATVLCAGRTVKELEATARSIAASRSPPWLLSAIVCSAAARSSPSCAMAQVRVPTRGWRSGARPLARVALRSLRAVRRR